TINCVATLVVVGVPGWYFGLLMEWVRSKLFTEIYWTVITYWWRFFSFYHDFKVKDTKRFLKGFAFNYHYCQIAFFVSGVLIAPIMFYWLYVKERKKEKAEAAELIRLAEEAREKQDKEETRKKIMEERERVHAERLRLEQEAKLEEKRKLEERIKEIKGKDPWDSGFL
ncbi:MAG: hypothetical protein AABZ60_07240, partial [Planctomycetota bacterium]